MTALTITARLGSPVVELDRRPLMLDGPLAWAAAQLDGWQPLLDHVPDTRLPLATWEEDGTYGWCVSQALYDPVAYTSVEVRRKPELTAYARYTRDGRFHSALGPHKARDTTLPATWVRTLTWHAEVTDVPRLRELLDVIHGVGKLAAHGYGRVLSWQVDPGPADGWRDRPMPSTHGPGRAYRPPYHLAERQIA